MTRLWLNKMCIRDRAKTTVSGLAYVKGTAYAGGFAGRLLPGDVAQTGSIKVLNLLDATQLLSVMDVALSLIHI